MYIKSYMYMYYMYVRYTPFVVHVYVCLLIALIVCIDHDNPDCLDWRVRTL